MLLSIGMIVKNEEKYLERCLTALKPILENVDSELIIADTGSTDNTVEIAKKFTDKVYYFEWINDFSAARNFTMEKSVGEWYMFLDADEIFQSCDEIIRFFNSGEYKAFRSASYKIRSYLDENNLNKYTDSVAMRLTRRSTEIKFINKVHEAISPLYPPIKMLGDMVDHYGYFFIKDGQMIELARTKSKRNLELLLEELNEPSVEFSVYREISDCYKMIDDEAVVLKYLDMGLDLLDHKDIAITQYFSAKAICLYDMNRYNELVDFCDQYFEESAFFRKKPIATDVDMYALRAAGYFCLDEYEKALEDYFVFFPIYKDYLNGKLNTLDLIYTPIKINDSLLKMIYARFLRACIKLKKYNTVLERLKDFPTEKFQSDKDYMHSHFLDRADIMEHTGWKSVKSFINTLDDENKTTFFHVLCGKTLYTDNVEDLIKVLGDFKNAVPCAEELIELYRSYYINNDLQFERVKAYIDNYGSDGYADILCIMLKCGMNISDFLTAKDFDAAKCANDIVGGFADQIILFEEYDVDTLSPNAVKNAASLYNRLMAEAFNSEKNVVKLFEQFGKIASKWQKEFPNEGNAPIDICIGNIVFVITEAKKSQDYRTCINEMRRLIKACPHFAPFVSEYRKAIEQEIMTPKDTRSELSEMAEMVKRNIRAMLDAGDISSAEKTLLELEKLCPSDAEIGMLKYHIKTLKMR
ncbi:MAG: glycosyltransferase family 2 protein [Oscillospiraceae bacterium]